MALGRGKELKIFMDELCTLEREFAATLEEELGFIRLYRWRPPQVERPALYNVLGDPSQLQQMDSLLWRDALTLQMRYALPPGDTDDVLGQVEVVIDRVREFFDPVFAGPGNPLQGAAREAHRTGIRAPIVDVFNEIPVLCVEAEFAVRFDRQIIPTT